MIYCIINIIGNILVFASVAFLIGKAAWEWQESERFETWKWHQRRRLKTWKNRILKKLLPLWEKAPILGTIYLVVASIIFYYLIHIFIKLSGQFSNIDNLEEDQLRNLAIAFLGATSGLAALFGGYLAILRSNTNERQTRTNEQGLITDRINKAAEGLAKNNHDGKPVVEVRLGALYALERIAQDSIRDHVEIMEILCSYIRHNSSLRNRRGIRKEPREDIQAAITIVGRRDDWPEANKRIKKETEKEFRIDLHNCDLRGAQLDKANLSRARLIGANLSGASLRRINLSHALLMDANMSKARLGHANLSHASLGDAIMIGVSLGHANLKKASAGKANLSGAQLEWADLSNAGFSRTNMTNVTLAGATLVKTSFWGADLSDAWMSGANLEGADLTGTNMNRTDLGRTNLTDARLSNTDMKDALLDEAFVCTGDLTKCRNLIPKQLKETFCGIKVRLSKGFKPDPGSPTNNLSFSELLGMYIEWLKERKKRPFKSLDPKTIRWKTVVFKGT